MTLFGFSPSSVGTLTLCIVFTVTMTIVYVWARRAIASLSLKMTISHSALEASKLVLDTPESIGVGRVEGSDTEVFPGNGDTLACYKFDGYDPV